MSFHLMSARAEGVLIGRNNASLLSTNNREASHNGLNGIGNQRHEATQGITIFSRSNIILERHIEEHQYHEEDLTRTYSQSLRNRFTIPIEKEQPTIENIKKETGVAYMVPGADPDIISYAGPEGQNVFQMNITCELPPNPDTRTIFYPGGSVLRPRTDNRPKNVVVAFTADSIDKLPESDPRVIFELNKDTALKDLKGGVYQYEMWASKLKYDVGLNKYLMYTTAELRPFPAGNYSHRPIVYTADSPRGPFNPAGLVGDNHWGIDFNTAEGVGFWSGWLNGTDGFQVIKAARMDSPTTMSYQKPNILTPPLQPREVPRQLPIVVNEGPQPFYKENGDFGALFVTKGKSWEGIGEFAYRQWVMPFNGKPGSDISDPSLYGKPYPLTQYPIGMGHGKADAVLKKYFSHAFYEPWGYGWHTRWITSTDIAFDELGLPHLQNFNEEAILKYRAGLIPKVQNYRRKAA